MSRGRDRAYLKPAHGAVLPLASGRRLALLIMADKNQGLLGQCLTRVTEYLCQLPVYMCEVVEPVSVTSWRNQLARILVDPAALPELGRRGLERMRTRYTVAAVTDTYVETIGAVL
ncbi:MAG TPA: hypothetical protein VMD08_13120 [Candidatus Baltobacteraceae bacterium]|nr:hypothetical protein [Candidatus Baltobacteraceae bacterium]